MVPGYIHEKRFHTERACCVTGEGKVSRSAHQTHSGDASPGKRLLSCTFVCVNENEKKTSMDEV